MRRSVHRFLVPLLAIAITAGAVTALAQKSSSKSSAKSKEKVVSKYHRLPAYYAQLKLKDEQKEEIYKLKEDYGEQIDELQDKQTLL